MPRRTRSHHRNPVATGYRFVRSDFPLVKGAKLFALSDRACVLAGNDFHALGKECRENCDGP
jgi:hypothetical protein